MKIAERLPYETGRAYALRVLKENIIELELMPGCLLSEKNIADELELSRTPVREAIQELANVEIIEVMPQKGSRCSLIDYHLIEEASFMRHVLECAVVELACECLSEADHHALSENLVLQKFYKEHYDAGKLLELDDAFHKKLFEIAGKPHVYALSKNLQIHFDRARSLSLKTIKQVAYIEDHEEILEAITSKNPARSRELMKKHLSRYSFDIREIYQIYPQYFTEDPKNRAIK